MRNDHDCIKRKRGLALPFQLKRALLPAAANTSTTGFCPIMRAGGTVGWGGVNKPLPDEWSFVCLIIFLDPSGGVDSS